MTFLNPIDCPYYLITRVSLVVTSAMKKGFAASGVSQVKPAYLSVLLSLWQEDGLKVIDLGKRAGLESSTMTGLLDRMERDGLVTRTADPEDRRVQRIFLTQDGQTAQEPTLKAVDSILTTVFQGIPQDELSVTKNLLRRVLANAHET